MQKTRLQFPACTQSSSQLLLTPAPWAQTLQDLGTPTLRGITKDTLFSREYISSKPNPYLAISTHEQFYLKMHASLPTMQHNVALQSFWKETSSKKQNAAELCEVVKVSSERQERGEGCRGTNSGQVFLKRCCPGEPGAAQPHRRGSCRRAVTLRQVTSSLLLDFNLKNYTEFHSF